MYFDSFEIEHVSQEVLNKIKDKSITHDIIWIQSDDSIMCGFSCIAFIEYMIAGQTLLEYTSPVGIGSSVPGLTTCDITAGIKKYKSLSGKRGKIMIK